MKKKFRTIEEIRAELKELEVEEKPVYDVMKDHFGVATNAEKDARSRLEALENLQDYLHKVSWLLAKKFK